MPNVLILGGSGYMGLAAGQALLRSGNYAVWGSARSTDKAKTLQMNEITPVEGDITDAAVLSKAISSNNIDVVVDCTSAYQDATNILAGVTEAAKARSKAFAAEKTIGPKLGFVYTSGSWVHGSPGRRVSDLTPVGTSLAPAPAATAVGWRPAHEQALLAARDLLDVAIIRPSLTYGRASWAWAWFGALRAAAQSGSSAPIQIPADRAARTGAVHVDDLADAFVKAVDRINGGLGAWPVFDIATETLSVVDIMEAAKASLGITAPLEYAGTQGNAFLEALSLVNNTESSRARTVLGWEPKRRDMVDNMPAIIKAWEAAQEGK